MVDTGDLKSPGFNQAVPVQVRSPAENGAWPAKAESHFFYYVVQYGMRILLTGGFGNIGQAVIKEAENLDYGIHVFDIDTKKNHRMARKYNKAIDRVTFGNIQNVASVKTAVKQCDAVIHLAAILPPTANMDRDRCMTINFDGTRNIVEAITSEGRVIPVIVTSSVSVMGPTQKNNRLVCSEDPLVATDYYSESKIKVEEYLKDNYDNYIVFRIAGVMPTYNTFTLGLLGEMFNLHPEARMEMILDRDAALALLNGITYLMEHGTKGGRVFILGGGKVKGWQLQVQDLLGQLFGSLDLPLPDRKYFAKDLSRQYIDWYDTNEAQKLFQFQRHELSFYFDHLKNMYGKYRFIIRLFNKVILKKIVSHSPHFSKASE